MEVVPAPVVESLADAPPFPILPFPILPFPILPFQVPTLEFNSTPVISLTALELAVVVTVVVGTLFPPPPPLLLPTAGWLDEESSGQSITFVAAPGNVFPCCCSVPFVALVATDPPESLVLALRLDGVFVVLADEEEEEKEREEEGVDGTDVEGVIFGVSKAVLAAASEEDCEERVAAS